MRENFKIDQKSEASLRFLADAASEGISITRKGKILLVNEALVEMFGYNSKKELLGKFDPNYFPKKAA